MSIAFHEVRFPLAISRGARGGPERRTEIVTLGSGREERNARWADSRRRWNAGVGLRSLDAIHTLLAFFEERRGRLYGFRWKDAADFRSGPPGSAITPADQLLGTGDGTRASFALIKTYGSGTNAWQRRIQKPVSGTLRLAVAGSERPAASVSIDWTTGLITFPQGAVPANGQSVTVGFEFDTPARFDTDFLEIDLAAFQAGEIPDIPVVEIRL